MAHQVFLVSYAGAPRDHQVIFVETNPDRSGQLFQVTGNIQTGMRYESKAAKRPEDSASFVKKELLGSVTTANFSRIDPACRSNPPPAKQFNGPKRINPHIPLRRCQEWTKETIQTLKNEGIIQ
jgi:hypothetical protein